MIVLVFLLINSLLIFTNINNYLLAIICFFAIIDLLRDWRFFYGNNVE